MSKKEWKITHCQNNVFYTCSISFESGSKKFEDTFYNSTTRQSFTQDNFLSRTWAGSFLSSKFRKTEGNQKWMKNSVDWYSTARSPHPCVGEIVHTFGLQEGIEATSHRKCCLETWKVSLIFSTKLIFLSFFSNTKFIKIWISQENLKPHPALRKIPQHSHTLEILPKQGQKCFEKKVDNGWEIQDFR